MVSALEGPVGIRASLRREEQDGRVQAGAVGVSTSAVSPRAWAHRLSLRIGPGLRRATLDLRVEGEEAWCLSADRELQPVVGATRPPRPVGRFVVVRSGARLRRFEFPWAAGLDLDRRGESLAIRIEVVDLEACGLSRWGPDKMSASLPPVLEVFEDDLESLDDCLWLEPFPDGARAALCLTDHPDFDSVEKVRALTALFGRLDLRLTKGAFPVREPLGAKQEPGADVPEYRRLLEDLHGRGNEIAFHGIGPRPRAPEAAAFRARLESMRAFAPSTWIDHGVGDYLFSRRARLADGQPLVDLLSDFGIVNYWAYVDGWSNPFGDLRSEARRGDAAAFGDFLRAVGRVTGSARGVKGLLYPASHLANNLLGENGALAVRGRPFSAAAWRAAGASRRGHRVGCARPLSLYGLDGRSFAATDGPLWIFDTLLLSHPAFELDPAAVDRLCRTSALSLVHCYLACTHPYIGGGCFADPDGRSLHPAFVANLEHIALRQREGELCVLPFRDLRASLVDFRRARLTRVREGWTFAAGSAGARAVIGGSPRALDGLRGEGGSRIGGSRRRLRVTAAPGAVFALSG